MDTQELATKPVDELKSRIKPTFTAILWFFGSKSLLASFLAATKMKIVLLTSKIWK